VVRRHPCDEARIPIQPAVVLKISKNNPIFIFSEWHRGAVTRYLVIVGSIKP
jgi:hypothetical protein